MSKAAEINIELLLEFKSKGLSNQSLAHRFKVSKSTIKRRLAENKSEDDKKVSAFTAQLVKMLEEVPDDYCRRELNRTIAAIRLYKEESEQARFERILHSIKSEAREADEIAEDCDLPARLVKSLLDELIRLGKINKNLRGGILNRGRKTKYHYTIA